MRYLKVIWHHESPDEPVVYYSEIGDDGYETRKIQVYRDGRAEWADESYETDTVGLGEVPVGSIEEIAAQDDFTPTAISAAEFEAQWRAAVEAS